MSFTRSTSSPDFHRSYSQTILKNQLIDRGTSKTSSMQFSLPSGVLQRDSETPVISSSTESSRQTIVSESKNSLLKCFLLISVFALGCMQFIGFKQHGRVSLLVTHLALVIGLLTPFKFKTRKLHCFLIGVLVNANYAIFTASSIYEFEFLTLSCRVL